MGNRGFIVFGFFPSLLNEAITLFFYFNKQMTSTTFCELILCICL